MLLSSERSAWRRSPWRCEHPHTLRSNKNVTVRCRKRDCAGCGRWWTHDQREKIYANLKAYKGHTALVTITAPGVDVLPWDESRERCQWEHLASWNYLAPKRWRDLHRVASKRAKRVAGDRGWSVLAKVWQEQRRGALHVHVVVPMATDVDRLASKAYVDALHENARAHVFGFVDRKLELRSPERSAGYIARYVASELAMCRNLPGHVVDVARSLTARTGVTVRSLRAARAEHARKAGAQRDLTAKRLPASDQLQLVDVGRRTGRPSRARSPACRPLTDAGTRLTLEQLRAVWAPILG